jgi:protein-disulfide isomerase
MQNSGSEKKDSPAGSARVWRIAFLVFCTAGVLLSADLLRLHVRVHTDPNYHSYCAVNEYMDCEEVALSEHAVFGGLPVALWGVLGYLFMGGLCIWGLRRRLNPVTWPFGILFGLSAFSVAVSLFMFFISHAIIKSLCIVCLATYGVNVILGGLSLTELRLHGSGPLSAMKKELGAAVAKWRPVGTYALSFSVAVVALWIVMPVYWVIDAATGPGGLPVGETADGAHWIGARRPVLEIAEFSDYQCPYCQRGHAKVREMVAAAPKKIRLIHRHFPLRSHPFAFDYAVLSHCAGQQNRFWEANDYLFANGRRKDPVTADELAALLDIDGGALEACLASEASRQAVVDDVQAGRDLRVRGTPTFIIGDKNYPGGIPPEVFEPLLSK